MVKRQLKKGEAFIVYDEATQTANIVLKKPSPTGAVPLIEDNRGRVPISPKYSFAN